MGNKTLVYKQKVHDNLSESYKHLSRLQNAIEASIVNVDEWFEIRDLRNEIAHDYEDNDEMAINILNTIHKLKSDLKETLDVISKLVELNR